MKTPVFSPKVSAQRLRRWLAPALAVCLILWSASSASAQALSGINGTVTDSSGALIAGAKVTATNDATNVATSTVTSSAGTYLFNNLIPGSYTIRVEMDAFQASIHNGVNVDVSKVSTVDAALQPGNVSQTVEVTENVIALDTTQPNLNTSIETKVVEDLPNEISGGRGRQIDALVFLAPGVTGSSFSHRINGGVDFENEVVYNGIPMAQSETQGFSTIWNPPYELVNEFNVLRSSFSAQYGLAQGAVTYNTASGTNQLHGDGFEIIRNNFFDSRGSQNLTVPIDKENNYGFSVGGPVIIPKLYNGKNRTFFHLSMEWYRQNQTQTGTFSLPTAAEKAGDFSALPVVIYNPVGSGCSANGNIPGTPFKGNMIPTACFSPLSASLLSNIPTPAGSGFVNNSNNLEGVFPTRQNPWGFTIDHTINDKQTIHWTEWRDKQTSYGGGDDLPQLNPLQNNTYFPDLGTVFILNYSYAISPHLVVTAGASWLGELNFQLPQRAAAGLNPDFPAAPGTPIYPGINFAGPDSPGSLGTSNSDSVNRKLGWVFENNYLWVKGRHTFNIGWELHRTYQDDNECQQCAGNFNFSNNTTADPNFATNGDLGTTGNSFASFLLGSVDSSDREGTQEERLRNWDVSTYIQDDIKLNPKLTLNVGLRYDIMVPFTAIGNYIVYFDSTIANPAAGGLPGAATKFGDCTGCAQVDRAAIHWNHLSPRLGVSYALNNKTVLQGGFSMNYLDGGAYEYGTSKVAVNYGNLLNGAFFRNSTGTTSPAFGSWDTNSQPLPAPVPFNPTIGNAAAIDAFDPKTDGRAPYDVVWSIGVQRELPFNILMTAAYTGNRGDFLPGQLNPINQITPASLATYGACLGVQLTLQSTTASCAGTPTVASPYPSFISNYGSAATVLQALRPYPQFSSIFDNFDDSASSLYNAAQIQIQKRYTSGLSFLVSYTLSRMMSNTSSGFTSFNSASLNKDNQKSEWSIDNNDQTNLIAIAGTYELPFGKGKPFLHDANRITDALIGGWSISPLLTYSTGGPLEVYVAGNPLGNGTNNRPNIVTGVQQQFSYNNVYSGTPVLNAAAFSDPGQWAIGDEPRYIPGIRNPWNLNENFAAAKSFHITEKVTAKIEMEYFNAFNRVIFCGPDTNLEDVSNGNFGKVINCQANGNRQGQAHFSIRF